MCGDGVEGGSETHAEAEAGDEGEGATAPDGEHRDVKGPVFGADLCDIFQTRSSASPKRKERKPSVRGPSKMGHGPLVVMYPVSLWWRLT